MQNTKPNKKWIAEIKQVPKHRRSENATFVRDPKVTYNKLSLFQLIKEFTYPIIRKFLVFFFELKKKSNFFL